ncbi:MAG TPA: AMP-binding protein [Candidatus Deferrimicrobiaceae bacterium]|jgi:long-chain-fatty-acid--[acyl-carrier-protein] ligase
MNRLLLGLVRAILSLRYRVRVEGLDALEGKPFRGCLILPNHPALVDPLIVLSNLYPALEPATLADRDQMKGRLLGALARRLRIHTIPDPAVYGESCRADVEAGLRACAADLKSGRNVLIYPAGRIMRSKREELRAASAVDTLLAEVPNARLLVVKTTGLWGSGFSFAGGKYPDFGAAVSRGIKGVLAGGLFFAPRRPVTIAVTEPPLLRTEGRLALNQALEAIYNQDIPPATYVPYSPFEKGGVREMPDLEKSRTAGDASGVATDIREKVLESLREMCGVDAIRDDLSLSRDLAMDSLKKLELLLFIEGAFGKSVRDPESLQTVADALLAAAGQLVEAPPELSLVPGSWFANGDRAPAIPEGDTIPEVFLRMAALGPDCPVLADQTSGVKRYRDLVLGILALKPEIEKLEGDYLGLMFPASAGVGVLYLATLFAGKTPVMLNWTVGERNLAHALDLLKIRHILTAGALLRKLREQGIALDGLADRFLTVESLAPRIGKGAKVKALLRSRLSWRSLRHAKIPATAVVLFTSGSENLPKAVPLTHGNLLANLRDVLSIVEVTPQDRLLSMLPPFHSFGLTGNLLLPLLSGLPAAFHPNPTEGPALSKLCEAYRASILMGTPTFLKGIVQAAGDAQLATLRLVVTGAEKCPEALYETISRRKPDLVVLEGYGITECSPIVSVNRVEDPRPGTVGKLLPGVEGVLKDPEGSGRAPEGMPGMLLVRGKSIFGGYLFHDGPSPFERFEGKDWYRTGDLVRRNPDGSLVFAGRLKRFVKIGGEMVSLPAIEEVLVARFQGAEASEPEIAVESDGSEEQPELILYTTRNVDRETANAAIREAGLSPIHHVRKAVRLEKIPLLGTGKTDYRALRTQNS